MSLTAATAPWQLHWKQPKWMRTTTQSTTATEPAAAGAIPVGHCAARLFPLELTSHIQRRKSQNTGKAVHNKNGDLEDTDDDCEDDEKESDTLVLTVTLLQAAADRRFPSTSAVPVAADMVQIEIAKMPTNPDNNNKDATMQAQKQQQQQPVASSSSSSSSSSSPVDSAASGVNNTNSNFLFVESTPDSSPTLPHSMVRQTNFGDPASCSSNISNSSSTIILHSKLLRWPTATDKQWDTDLPSTASGDNNTIVMFDDNDMRHTKNNESTTCWELKGGVFPLLALFSGFPCLPRPPQIQQPPETSRQRRNNNNNHDSSSSGLVAVTMVRWPTHATAATTTEADVENILQSLALGDKLVVEQQQISNDGEADQSHALPPPANLWLACLTNDGKVHFYSPLSLLFNVAPPQNDGTDGMAAFLLGSSLLSIVQENQLPLSEPLFTVNLSVSLLRYTHNKGTFESVENSNSLSFDNDDETGATEYGTGTSERTKTTALAMPPRRFWSIFDASMWRNPSIDPGTLIYQTRDNVPTHCVAVLDFICIAGKGRRRWQPTTPGSSGEHDTNATTRSASEGGFLTLIEMNTFSEKRILFLPFAPQNLSPFSWGGMTFLLVTGPEQALAIRLDDSPAMNLPTSSFAQQNIARDMGNKTLMKSSTTTSNTADDVTAQVQRFQILPIDLAHNNPRTRIERIIGCDVSVSPPSLVLLLHETERGTFLIVQRTLHAMKCVSRKNRINYEFSESTPPAPDGRMAVITTIHPQGHAASINLSNKDVKGAWFHLGQGWCIVGLPCHLLFLCFEGANSERGAFVYELDDDLEDSRRYDQALITGVIPADHTSSPINIDNQKRLNASEETNARSIGIEQSSQSLKGDDELDVMVVEAMESISRLSFRESNSGQSPTRKKALSLKEKSERLLNHCSTEKNSEWSLHPFFLRVGGSPTLSIKTKSNDHFTLVLRQAAVASGAAAPFQNVLTWLTNEKNYFTAASLALDLLRDVDSLRHLWKTFDKIDNYSERSKLDGLLDGIIPIYDDDRDVSDSSALTSTLAQLADMTVNCLIQGGYSMSSTLEQFLVRSSRYNPTHASLLLVATAASALSSDEELALSLAGSMTQPVNDNYFERLLWPIRCLLSVGVARNRLGTTLLILNTTIPDQLRRREDNSTVHASVSSMDLCKALVYLLVACSTEAVEMLLDLVDEKTRLRYWDSLSHDVRLELSLIEINGKYPLLWDHEVRAWGLKELNKCVEREDSAATANIYDVTPTLWLQALIVACLTNAGCDIGSLLTRKEEEMKVNLSDESSLQYHQDLVRIIREALAPVQSSGGLDFGLLIPALLIIEHREGMWHNDGKNSTRCVLNEACYLAGRRSNEEPLFPLNSVTLMKQCALLGDVEAGANLIGGKNGLILHCCHLLIEETHMTMDEAEGFLLDDNGALIHDDASRVDAGGVFLMQPCHRKILWLLEEHVLNIKTYGEFTESRGKVSPVFAATVCLRTWLAITQQTLHSSTDWLVQWLRRRLSMTDRLTVSPNRLVCAALIRALIWRDGNDSKTAGSAAAPALANQLKMDVFFLIQLSRACCGLVEALPDDHVAHTKGRMPETTPTKRMTRAVALKTPLPATPAADSVVTNEALDETFVSAAASLGDLNLSLDSW